MTTDAIERIKGAETAAAESEKKAKADAQAIAEKAKSDAAELLEKTRKEGAELVDSTVAAATVKAKENSKKNAERIAAALDSLEKTAQAHRAAAADKIREKIISG